MCICLDVDECSSSPCKHADKCTDQINGFKCKCSQGYEGDMCEIGKYRSCLMLLHGGIMFDVAEDSLVILHCILFSCSSSYSFMAVRESTSGWSSYSPFWNDVPVDNVRS